MEGECASEGVVEVLIEPVVPAPLLAVVGESPRRARSVSSRVRSAGASPRTRSRARMPSSSPRWATATRSSSRRPCRPAPATSGLWRARGGRPACSQACATGARRGGGPARPSARGLDLGPSTQEEIAVAILAELVAWRHTRPGESPVPAEAVDPVCGMTVSAEGAVRLEHEGATVVFCSAHCRARFEAEPERYA